MILSWLLVRGTLVAQWFWRDFSFGGSGSSLFPPSLATRRVSTGAALKMLGVSGGGGRDKSRSPERSGRGSASRPARKNLPIINPLVMLPMWPSECYDVVTRCWLSIFFFPLVLCMGNILSISLYIAISSDLHTRSHFLFAWIRISKPPFFHLCSSMFYVENRDALSQKNITDI